MKPSHWFVEAVYEMINDARSENQKHVVCGLRTAFEVFQEEANFTDEDRLIVERLMHEDAQGLCEMSYSH